MSEQDQTVHWVASLATMVAIMVVAIGGIVALVFAVTPSAEQSRTKESLIRAERQYIITKFAECSDEILAGIDDPDSVTIRNAFDTCSAKWQ